MSPPSRRPRVAGLRDPRRRLDGAEAPADTASTADGASDTTEPRERRPRPATATAAPPGPPRRRPEPTREPAPEPEPEPEPAPAPTTTDDGTGAPGAVRGLLDGLGRSRTGVRVALGAVVVVGALLAGLAGWQGHRAATDGPVANRAVVDEAATAEVVGQTREAVEKIFSYDFTRLDDSVTAARTLSTGSFTGQYLDVFERTIRGPAGQQQLRQTASVLQIGVQQLTGDRATLMAMVQFSAQRTTTGQATNAPGLLRVEMQRVDGRWKLSKLEPLTAGH